ncbi:MAG: YceI family protein [Alphaproteobacteria bacterium]
MSAMSKAAGFLLIATFILGVAKPSQAAPAQYVIDPEHFSVGFMVSHIGYANLLGMFLEAEGSFSFDEATASLSDIRIEIDASSVFTNHKKRDKHLRSPDFLNAREFPKIVFTGSRAEKTSETTGIVEGNLELLGQSRPVTLDITLNKAAVYPFGHKKHTLGLSARASFKRSAFGMTYSLNDLVGDNVDLILEFEAIQQ